MRPAFTALFMGFLATSAIAEPRDNQTVTVGAWAIATNYKTDKFESCTMKRSAGELGITFARAQDGLVVLLDSPKWKLNRGKAYPVRLVAGSRSVDAQALAETKSVTIASKTRDSTQSFGWLMFLKCVEKGPRYMYRWMGAPQHLSDWRHASINARRPT